MNPDDFLKYPTKSHENKEFEDIYFEKVRYIQRLMTDPETEMIIKIILNSTNDYEAFQKTNNQRTQIDELEEENKKLQQEIDFLKNLLN